MMFWYGDHMSGWGYALMGASILAFWGLVIALIVFLVRHLGGAQDRQVTLPHKPTAEELLADRFARGEIDEQEYRQRLETLRAGA